jgi:NAD-dependent dihydropyrimidine dehydrogenase PreA subunit
VNKPNRCDLRKGRLIDLRCQRELHSLQNHGLRGSVPRGLLYEGENMLVIDPDERIDCGVCVTGMPGRRDQAGRRARA